MVSTPRIITVDPTGAIARIVRSAMDLLDLSVIQIDVPSSRDALDEVEKANLVVTALSLDEDMKGFEFALRVKNASATTSVIILGDVGDPDELDEETASESPFVYMSRPVDIHRFLRVLLAGLESSEAMLEAATAVHSAAPAMTEDMGPIPSLDLDKAKATLDDLQAELGAMAIILADRSGVALLETGTAGFINRDDLSQAMMPSMQSNIGVKPIIGGQVSSVQLYDGEEYDVFVLSVGLHHFLTIVFDGSTGSRQFGAVNRFGRRAVENLIGLIGADAFIIIPPQARKQEETLPKRKHDRARPDKVEEPVELARAEIDFNEPEPEPILEKLDPVEDFDPDLLFGSNADVDEDFFDLDNLEQIAKENDEARRSTVNWDEAERLGLINNRKS